MASKIFIGTGAIAYREWKGKFYPRDLPQERALDFYRKTFSALELNDTFYRLPNPRALKDLARKTPADFPFAVKMTGRITHLKRLQNSAVPVRQFFKALESLGKHPAVPLIQLPPNFKADLPRLEAFFKLIPKKYPVAMEFRHASWFVPEVFAFLKKKRAALVWNDTDIKMPYVGTADWGFVRLRRLRYSEQELRKWKRAVTSNKWRRAYVIFKHEKTVTAPGLARRFSLL